MYFVPGLTRNVGLGSFFAARGLGSATFSQPFEVFAAAAVVEARAVVFVAEEPVDDESDPPPPQAARATAATVTSG